MPNDFLQRLHAKVPELVCDPTMAIASVVFETDKVKVNDTWLVTMSVDDYKKRLRQAIVEYERQKKAEERHEP